MKECTKRNQGCFFFSAVIKVRVYNTLINCTYILLLLQQWIGECNSKKIEERRYGNYLNSETSRCANMKKKHTNLWEVRKINKYYAFTGELRHQWMLSEHFTLAFHSTFLFSCALFPFHPTVLSDKTAHLGNYSTIYDALRT